MSAQSSAPLPRRPAAGWHHQRRGGRWPAIAAIVALHGLGLYAALQIGAVRETIEEAAPLFVSFIAAPPAPEVKAPPPTPEPLKPKHEPRLISTPQPSASPMQTPPQPVHEEPVAEVTPPTPPAPPAPAPAAPITPPNFVAAYLDNPTPEYPRLSRRMKESGTVLLRVRVSPEGRSAQVELNQSSGYERLDQAAVEAVRRWRFAPARQGEQAVSAWVLVPINFQLEQ
ncbi:energy transducer TonB [Nevskia soli]|uniref:energy transducer TonB n=1 Tax=Nevskia soli TaxID=418856 RepID=UPI000691F097|nr:energy transducer TonB [Nevskia soli]